MRLSVLAGAVLLASGFLVLSRPLSARQETGDFSFPYSLLASALPDSNSANTYLASSGISEPSPEVNTAFVSPGTSPAPQGINLAPYSGPSIYLITPAAETSTGLYGNYLSESPARSPLGLTQPNLKDNSLLSATPSVGNAPTISEAVKESFSRFGTQGNQCRYGTYGLSWLLDTHIPSGHEISLNFLDCKPSLRLDDFELDFASSESGFVLHVPGNGQVFSIMNNVYPCHHREADGKPAYNNGVLEYDDPCPDLGKTLSSMKQAWETAVQEAFPRLQLVSSGLIKTMEDLKQFEASSGLSSLLTPR
ncbi:hypothetical protein MMC07_005596 [Pseudocyphellaria aurata]|nr:hypothetical protein [Pseudocyphellaria aurata]